MGTMAGRDARPTGDAHPGRNSKSGEVSGKGDPAGRPYGDRDLTGEGEDTQVRPYGEVPKRSLGGKVVFPSWSLGMRGEKITGWKPVPPGIPPGPPGEGEFFTPYPALPPQGGGRLARRLRHSLKKTVQGTRLTLVPGLPSPVLSIVPWSRPPGTAPGRSSCARSLPGRAPAGRSHSSTAPRSIH